MIGNEVTLVIHHRYGGEVRVSTMQVQRTDLGTFLEGIGRARHGNGMVTLNSAGAIVAAIAAQCIELVEVKP